VYSLSFFTAVVPLGLYKNARPPEKSPAAKIYR